MYSKYIVRLARTKPPPCRTSRSKISIIRLDVSCFGSGGRHDTHQTEAKLGELPRRTKLARDVHDAQSFAPPKMQFNYAARIRHVRQSYRRQRAPFKPFIG